MVWISPSKNWHTYFTFSVFVSLHEEVRRLMTAHNPARSPAASSRTLAAARLSRVQSFTSSSVCISVIFLELQSHVCVPSLPFTCPNQPILLFRTVSRIYSRLHLLRISILHTQSLRVSPHILLSILRSHPFSICSSLCVSAHMSAAYSMMGLIHAACSWDRYFRATLKLHNKLFKSFHLPHAATTLPLTALSAPTSGTRRWSCAIC